MGAVSQYDILRKLARGGMGEVYLARQTGIEGFAKEVVLKRIHTNYAEDSHFVEMFLQEARIAALLDHPNIVQIYELGKLDNDYFIVMEYVRGLSLSRLIKVVKGPLPLPVAIQIVAGVAAGLQFAHDKTDSSGQPLNLVHRDVSPPNILLSTSGSIKITDFGIAKIRSSVTETQAGVIKGKFSYISPEQACGQRANRQSDIYSLGLILYEITTGHRVYPPGGEADVLRDVAAGKIPPPRQYIPDYPEDLRAVLMRALAYDPSDRYAECQELQEDLLSLLVKRNIVTSPAKLGQYVQEQVDRIEARRSSSVATELPVETAPGEEAPKSAISTVERLPVRPGEEPSAVAQQDPLSEVEYFDFEEELSDGEEQFDDDAETIMLDRVDAPPPLPSIIAERRVNDHSSNASAVRPEEATGSVTGASGELRTFPRRSAFPWAFLFISMVIAGATFSWVLMDSDKKALRVAKLQKPAAQPPATAPLPPKKPSKVLIAHTPDAAVEPAKPKVQRSRRRQRIRRRSRSVTPKKQEPKQALVSLILSSVPDADVFHGKKRLGRTPLETQIPQTTTRITLKNTDVGLFATRTLNPTGTQLVARFVFKKGTIKFNIPSGRRIVLDGKSLGTAPINPMLAYEGSHLVQIVDPDSNRRWKYKVIVQPKLTTWVTQSK